MSLSSIISEIQGCLNQNGTQLYFLWMNWFQFSTKVEKIEKKAALTFVSYSYTTKFTTTKTKEIEVMFKNKKIFLLLKTMLQNKKKIYCWQIINIEWKTSSWKHLLFPNKHFEGSFLVLTTICSLCGTPRMKNLINWWSRACHSSLTAAYKSWRVKGCGFRKYRVTAQKYDMRL